MILIYSIMQQSNDRTGFMVFANRNSFQDKKIIPLRDLQKKVINNIKGMEFKPIFNEIQGFMTRESYNSTDLKSNTITFHPPHDKFDRARLANMYESDPNVKRIVGFHTQYVMGTKIRRKLVPIDDEIPPKRSELDKILDELLGGKKEHKKFKQFLAKVDHMADIFTHARKGYEQSFVYGTAAMWKGLNINKTIKTPKTDIEIKPGTPCYIKPINGFQLGRIHQNRQTFQPEYYEYDNMEQIVSPVKGTADKEYEELVYRDDLDNNQVKKEEPVLLPISRLILFNRNNPGVTPNTYYYGMSPLKPLIPHSENVRRIDQKILPELNETQYAPVGIFKVAKESSYNLEELAAQLSMAGNKIVINDEVEYQEVKINNNLEQILNEKAVLQDDLLMATGMPSSIFKSEKMVNRSTAEITVNIFKTVNLDDERDFINNIMWEYWYKDLMSIFFKEKYLDLEVKVELEFPQRTFTPFVDKAEANKETYLNGGMTLTEWRVGNDLTPVADGELKIPESADQKSNFGNAMGGNPGPNGSGTPTKSANNKKNGGAKPPSGDQNKQGNQNTVKQSRGLGGKSNKK